ncbi:MAG: hypothetical protein IPJ41_01615 [Phycisphaerales bacterium]|nr:hypothetical protein [Phycisphaerales bacterium]
MQLKNRVLGILAVCGAAAGAANAQPFVVNVSGSTLQSGFFQALASTNDFLDVDGDGTVQENLAPYDVSPPFNANQYWQIQYRGTGSGNGLAELVKWGETWAVGADCDEICSGDAAEGAYNNRTVYITNGGGPTGDAKLANPGAAPIRSLSDGSFFATGSQDPATTGILMDIAILDVPTSWFTYNDSGAPDFDLGPTQPGYGFNGRKAVNKDGSDAGQSNKLKSLGGLNTNTANPDANTVFDTLTATAPIGAMVNLGVGRSQMTYSELRHLNAAGRLPSGENLTQVTRDAGSGTRNAYNNSLCMDPSWGVGENVGLKADNSAEDLLGPNYIPSNKGGSSRMEGTVINTRLGVGYTGAERAVSKSWLSGGKAELLALKNDIHGDANAQYVRPNIDAILDNDYNNGYNITGPASWVTIGDPLAESVADGGDANGNPHIQNFAAAQFILNTTRSIEAFGGDPGGDETLFSPGEWLAVNLLLPQATDYVAPDNLPCERIANPSLNQQLQDFSRANSILGSAEFYSFGTHGLNGLVPARTTGVTYSDGVVGGGHYVNQGGATVNYGAALTSRNRIAGDFSGDGKRDINDAADLVKAYAERNGGAHWNAPNGTGDIAGAPGTDAVIEVLGDFNGDGNFDATDVRYWADGLGVNATSRVLDRAAAFTAIDTAFGGNFFGTTISTGEPYTAGASRADVAGNLTARGWAPIGADGVIDQTDVDYIKAQFIGNPFVTDGEANWDNLAEAVGFDLSCDITGDLKVNQADVDAINAILGLGCYADFNGDNLVDTRDVLAFLNAWNAHNASADCDNNGVVDTRDVLCFLNLWTAGC